MLFLTPRWKSILFSSILIISIATTFFSYTNNVEAGEASDEWFKESIVIPATGYDEVRLGAITVMSDGSWWVTCEAHEGSQSASPNDILLYRSYDNGSSWDGGVYVDDIPGGYNDATFTNPYFFEDATRGRIYFTVGERDWDGQNKPLSTYLFYRYTEDGGTTWSDWVDWSSAKPSWCLAAGNYAYVNPCQNAYVTSNGTIYMGLTAWDGEWDTYEKWIYMVRAWDGENFSVISDTRTTPGDPTNEHALVQLINGTFATVGRGQDGTIKIICSKTDEMLNWYNRNDAFTGVNAAKPGAIKLTEAPYTDRMIVMFTNHTERQSIDIAVSYDEGLSFPYERNVMSGVNCRYSHLDRLKNNTIIGCYEYAGGDDNVDNIRVIQCNLEWITQGADFVDEDVESTGFASINDVANNSFTSIKTRSFNWSIDDDALCYQLQIATDSGFSNIVLNLNDINETNYAGDYDEKGNYVEFDYNTPVAYGFKYYRVRPRYYV